MNLVLKSIHFLQMLAADESAQPAAELQALEVLNALPPYRAARRKMALRCCSSPVRIVRVIRVIGVIVDVKEHGAWGGLFVQLTQ